MRVKCEKCGQKFAKKSNLKRHHEKTVCGQSNVAGKSELESPVIEGPIIEIICEICNQKFAKEYGLKRHIENKVCIKVKLDSVETDFQCQRCFKHYSNKSNLRAHIRKVDCGPSVVQNDPKEVVLNDENTHMLSPIECTGLRFLIAKRVGGYAKCCYPLAFFSKRDLDLLNVEGMLPTNDESESILREAIMYSKDQFVTLSKTLYLNFDDKRVDISKFLKPPTIRFRVEEFNDTYQVSLHPAALCKPENVIPIRMRNQIDSTPVDDISSNDDTRNGSVSSDSGKGFSPEKETVFLRPEEHGGGNVPGVGEIYGTIVCEEAKQEKKRFWWSNWL